MAERKRIDIDKPLVDENLYELPGSKEVIELLSDENSEFDIYINVHNLEMVPTAIAMSMSKRINANYYATVSEFPGREYIYGYLKSGYFERVELK